MNNKYLLLPLLFLLSLKAVAQVSYNKRVMGTIGSAPKVGDFVNGASLDQVDMSTGTLKISIPLYEIKVNDISVPISLSYSATGLKVGQEAGVAGMGWELNAGGKIVTNVQGKVDGVGTGFSSTNKLPDPFYYQTLATGPMDPAHRTLLQNIVDGKTDNAWDTYSYSLPNGGGTYTANGLTFPYDPLVKIQHDDYKITTSDGLVYTFTTGDTKKTSKVIHYPINTPYPVTAYDLIDHDPTIWSDRDLYKIKSTRFGDEVNFKYKQIAGEYYQSRLAAKTRTNTSETLPLYRDVPPSPTGYGVEPNTAYSHDVKEPFISKSVTEYTSHTVLDTIDYKNGKVIFEYDNDVLGRDVLKNIVIYKKENGISSLLKRYRFIYWADMQYGHYLTRIDIFDSKNIYMYCWKFGYDDLLPVVPNSESKAQDRWGFYNGAVANKTLIESPLNNVALSLAAHYPINASTTFEYTRNENRQFYGTSGPAHSLTINGNLVTFYSVNYADRSFSFGNAKKGILVNLTTPTGAKYEYAYSPHRYSYQKYNGTPVSPGSPQTVVVFGGGIRVASITKRRLHANLYYGSNVEEESIKKEFDYGTATPNDWGYANSKYTYDVGQAGIPYTAVQNVSAYFDQFHTFNSMNPNEYTYVNNIMLLSHPINNMVMHSGSYVMYRSVTERLLQNESTYKSHGQTVYYSDFPKFDPYVTNGYYSNKPSGGTYHPYSSGGTMPMLSVNMGINAETGAGIYATDVMAFKNDELRLAKRTKYEFEFYPAPTSTEFTARNIYAALTGQLSGKYPSNPPSVDVTYNPPMPPERGGSVVNTFANTRPAGDGGTMDNLSRVFFINQGNTEDYPGKYDIKLFNMNNFSYAMRKVKETVTNFTSFEEALGSEEETTYVYGNTGHLLPTTIYKSPKRSANWDAPRTDTVITRIKYPADYYVSVPGVISYMRDSKIGANEPIEEVTTTKNGTPVTEKLIGGTINEFSFDNSVLVPTGTFKITPADGFLYANMTSSTGDTTLYKRQISYDKYLYGNVTQYTDGLNNANCLIWGYDNKFAIAKVANAGHRDKAFLSVAYTSFENTYVATDSRDTCNWAFSGSIVADTTSPSGKKVYQLGTGNITKVRPTESGKHIISYWYKNGSTVNVSGVTAGAAVIKRTSGPWTLAEREISAITGTITVSGSGFIDELRFHPKQAQMSTYLYDPHLGVTCTFDPNGKAQYYEYDDAQRLKQIRDQNGNIVKAYTYIIGNEN